MTRLNLRTLLQGADEQTIRECVQRWCNGTAPPASRQALNTVATAMEDERQVLARIGTLPRKLQDLLEAFFNLATHRLVAREKREAGAVLAGLGQGETRRLAGFGEKLVRHLDQDARAVTGVDLGTRGTAMVQVAEDLQTVGDHLVRLAAMHIDHEADATGLVLEERIVEALFGGETGATAYSFGVGRDVGGPRIVHWMVGR